MDDCGDLTQHLAPRAGGLDAQAAGEAEFPQASAQTGSVLSFSRSYCGPRISSPHASRRVLMRWRLTKPYLMYCFVCLSLTLFLLVWNLYKGMRTQWNLPRWEHHRWEEYLEVAIGALITGETLCTICVIGPKEFFKDRWNIFDFVVMVLTVISMTYGIVLIGQNTEIVKSYLPGLLARFLLQPARIVAQLRGVRRTARMQANDVALQVDFSAMWQEDGLTPTSQGGGATAPPDEAPS